VSQPSRFAGRRFKLLVTGLIAATTFVGAVASWRATEASGAARAADRKGVADQRLAAQQETFIRSTLRVTEFNYLRRTSLQAAAVQLRDRAAVGDPGDADRLLAVAAAFERAAAEQPIDPDALRIDGSLDLDTKFDIAWSAAALQQDLDPNPEFAAAAEKRLKSERIVGVTALLVAAALFFTLAQVTRADRGRRLYFAGGIATGITATVMLVVLELG
jgi:hypothetical protein